MLDLPFARWTWQVHRRILTGDAIWDSILGSVAEQAAQPGVEWQAFMDAAKWPPFRERLIRQLRQHGKVHFHLILRESGGQPIEFILHGMVADSLADGSPIQVVGLCRHMLAHESVAEEGTSATLEERRKLEALMIKAQRFEGIGKIAGGMAHDLNNLLAPIRMATEILQRKNRNEELTRFIEIIRSSTDRARDVIQQVLTFSREKATEQLEDIQPVDVLRDIERITRETFPKNIEIEFHCSDAVPLIHINPTRLHQAVLNLMINARDAISGQGRITVRCWARHFTLNLRVGNQTFNPGTYVCIEVADTGCGIPAAIRDSIFDPFFTTKPKGKGTGLGLASAYGIAAHAGGFIDVASEPQRGSVFTIYLPRVASPDMVSDATARTAHTDFSGRTIMLIDDEQNIIETLAPLLTEMGFKVFSFTDPEKALIQVNANPRAFDFILTDLRMPRVPGDQIVRAVRSQGASCHIILMTGDLSRETIDSLQAIGVDAWLAKPFLAEDLHKAFVACLSQPGRLK